MAGHRRMPDAIVAEMLGRLAISLSAGVDLRRGWEAESSRLPSRWRGAAVAVAAALREGCDFGTALGRAGDVFPPAVVGMVGVGDRTGRLPEALRDAAQAVEESVATRRSLRAALLGPAVQLGCAAVAVGVLVAVSGMAQTPDGKPFDLLGIGLTGRRGLVTLAVGVAAAGLAAALVAPAVVRSWRSGGWARAVGGRLPVVGGAVRAAEAATWCRAASFAAHAGVPVGEMVALAAQAAPGLAFEPAAIEARLRRGDDLATALAADGRLPRVVVEAVSVGEMTGTTAEALHHVAVRLDETARRGIAAAVGAAGFAAWAAVACLVAAVVIRVVGSYAAMIEDAARPW